MSRATILLLALAFSLFFSSSFAAGSKKKKEEIPGVMAGFREEILNLQPYWTNKAEYNAKKNENRIKASLSKLKTLSGLLDEHPRLKSASFEASAEVFKDQIAEAQQMFLRGSKNYSRLLLVSTFKVCSSCHSQVVQDKGPQWQIDISRVDGDLIQQGDFWYTIRHYDRALRFYKQAVNRYPLAGLGLEEVELSLERILSIRLRVLHEPTAALADLKEALNNKKLSDHILRRIGIWMEEIQKLYPQPVSNISDYSAAQIAQQAEDIISKAEKKSFQRLDDSQRIQFLYVAGLIYEFMNQRPKEVTAELLYWLAVCDHWLNDQFFFSLGNLYLKQCINKFPSSEFAGRCYQELENKIELSYTGSAGVNVPASVRADLRKLKAKIKN